MKELKVFHCKLVLINRETYFDLTHKHTKTRINQLSISLDDAVYIPEQKSVLILLKSNFYKENKPQSFFFNNTYFNFFVFLTRHNKPIYKINWVKGY